MDNGTTAMVMAAAMMAKLAERKNLPTPAEAEPLATTNTISPEELAEMNRAPRAYRRRMLKALRKQSKDPQP